MLATVARAIGPNDTSDEVERDLASKGAALLVATIEAMTEGRVDETPQIDADATYAPRLTKDEGLVDWSRPAEAIHNQIRGLQPWPHAFTFARGQRLILHRSATGVTAVGTDAPGTILQAAGDRLLVATGHGSLDLLVIQAEGKRPMAARDFLAGHPLAAGERFTTEP
jgi:methionyl-tRNA formyltransferase